PRPDSRPPRRGAGTSAPSPPSLLLAQARGVLGRALRLAPGRVELLESAERAARQDRGRDAAGVDGLERREQDALGLRVAAQPGEAAAELESDLERARVSGRECAVAGGGGALEERHRLAAAAVGAERACELAREDRDVRVVLAERGALAFDRLAVEAIRFAVLVPGLEQVRVVGERGRDGGGVGWEDAAL